MYTFSGPCWFDSICLIQIHIFYYGKNRSVLGGLCRIHLRTIQKQKKPDALVLHCGVFSGMHLLGRFIIVLSDTFYLQVCTKEVDLKMHVDQ